MLQNFQCSGSDYTEVDTVLIHRSLFVQSGLRTYVEEMFVITVTDPIKISRALILRLLKYFRYLYVYSNEEDIGNTRLRTGDCVIVMSRVFKIANQKISLDVDFENERVNGIAEIVLIPLIQNIEYITLDCNGLNVKDVWVENRRCDDYIHEEPSHVFGEEFTVENSHLMRGRFADLVETPSERIKSQLTIKVPSSLRITLQDTSSISNYTPITPSLRGTPSAFQEGLVYTPITIMIEYEVNNVNGIKFDTFEEDRNLWNAYTTNTELCASAPYWMPCVNSLDEKSTWELEFSVPRTIKDIGRSGILAKKEDDETELQATSPDIVICCSEFTTMKESMHPTDLSKKIISFQIFNPVAPHHIGWTVGAFSVINLPMESLSSGELVPVNIYTLRALDRNNEDENEIEEIVLNSTLVCHSIMDFYSKEFGSYPFTSYSIAFLPTVIKTMDFAGVTIMNSRNLYPTNQIEPVFDTTDELAWAIANQWSGVNITPLDLNDIWCCVGMAGYMVLMFIKHFLGNNELKYRLKINCEAIVERDHDMPPIGYSFVNGSYPISTVSGDLNFVKLKAPMVFYILDRRMTKTERSFGMSRVLPKIFLQAMSGDLPNNTLTASHFQHVCERVNKSRLGSFFQEWIYGSGVPVFRVTQRFNRKRMVVEMGIRQVDEEDHAILGKDGFFNSALRYLQNDTLNKTNVFTGSMTIRIHEADGTPYEHIVEIKDVFTKIEIQYNTKYRKMKKDTEGPRLGNVSFEGLTDISQTSDGKELQMQNEGFEWIRIDSDFEWLGKFHLNQPDYMYAAQLQQDGDVEAQVDALRYYEDVGVESDVYCSILTRTILDEKYFYGVRVEACKTLACSVKGAGYLVRIFKALFCLPGCDIPKNNDFTNFTTYFLQKGIVESLGTIDDENIQKFLLSILEYNSNDENKYDDTEYLILLLNAVKDKRDIVARLVNMEKWVPSYHDKLNIALQRLGAQDIATTTRNGHQDAIIFSHYKLLCDGGLKNKDILKYYFESVLFEPDQFIRFSLLEQLIAAINLVINKGLGEHYNEDIQFMEDALSDIEDEITERKERNMRSTIIGLITILRNEFKDYQPLKDILRQVVEVSNCTTYQKRIMFDVMRVLYSLTDKFIIKLPMPRDTRLVAKRRGKSVVIKRQGLMKLHIKAESKIKIKKQKTGTLPIRFAKIALRFNKSVTISSTPFSKNVSIKKVDGKSFIVGIKRR
ncbi:hypothetical protein NCAS_0B07500 [Naumovozyma castellii]|uniref:Transcription initiation factor TFIID subunit 2 n=1 Tax=Naumovozyma castellii TaxID=27288 RepID=G0VAA4_NAUCA|nr:hypothetical protein NCAS_0B07500 [Naumovozyma castellii CBS 4309]CCC68834.1 hypothetical protein NCAS_0B07500 [Naumovozyma castellii CBS 4309]